MARGDFEVNDLHTVGMVADSPSYLLPPEAWTLAEGVRFSDNMVVRLDGWASVFGTPSVVPYFAMGLLDGARSPWWIYTSLTKAYTFHGSTHANITRQSGGVDVNYTVTDGEDWEGTILAGIPIINNGTDVPQFWADYSTAQRLQDLTNWPSTLRAKRVIAFGPFLFALNCLKSGTRFPHLIKWSHPAAPGALPVSWDETDLTRDTGEYELPSDSPGGIISALPLKDHLYIYKEGAIWRARYIGGRAVFAFQEFSNGVGTIGLHSVCLAPNGSGHVFVSNDDVMFHTGQGAPQSIIDGRNREALFATLNPDARHRVFAFANKKYNEVWICYPETGQDYPSRALIWNMRSNAWTTAAGINFRHAALGPVEEQVGDTWTAAAETWDSIDDIWGRLLLEAVVLSAPDSTALALLDVGTQRLDASMSVSLMRAGISFIGRSQNGAPIVDFKQRKLVTRVWFKGTGKFNVRLGAQTSPTSPITWSPFTEFDTTTSLYVDFTTNGRAVALEFTAVDEEPFALMGYKVELRLLGHF